MSVLQKLGGGTAYFKGGFLGFQGSGKSYTMALLAIAIRRHFDLKGPIAMFDTEGGSEYIARLIRDMTGSDLVGVKSRSLDDLRAFVDECPAAGVSVGIAESMTHVWRELCDAYLAEVNERRKKDRLHPRRSLEFQDWGPLKRIWNTRWADVYLNAPLHLIIAGRAGYEYDYEENEETKKKELTKTGIRMKTEGEFGFEPSLLVEMEREQVPDGEGGFRIVRRATVLKDRFAVIDAATTVFDAKDPAEALEKTWEFFAPHVRLLTPGAHSEVDTRLKTHTGADEDGDTEWARERRQRQILCEEIAGALVKYGLDGQGRDEKAKRLDLLESVFRTRSWTQIEAMPSDKLRAGLAEVRKRYESDSEAPQDATGGVSPEEAERILKVAAIQGLEKKLALMEDYKLEARKSFAGTKVIEEAALDGLLAYEEHLKKIETRNGKGKKS